MRRHRQIISEVGPKAFQARLGLEGKLHTVRSWAQRDSIPAEHWRAVAAAGLATLEELAEAAEDRARDAPCFAQAEAR